MALSLEQLGAMGQAANAAPANPTNNQPDWLKAMIQSAPDHSQSAMLLGHATGLLGNAFKTPLTDISSGNAQGGIDTAIGAGKQALSDISMAGAQHAGPVGAQMMADANAKGGGAAEFAQGITATDKALQPSNLAQAQGAAQTSIGEALIPGKALYNALSEGGPIAKIANTVSDKIGLTDYLANRAVTKATNAVQSTAETMTKAERESAIAAQRLQPGLLKNTYLPSETETRAGQLLSGKVGGNAIKNVPIVQSEIAARGKEAEQFLAENAKPITNEEDFAAFQKQRAKTETYLTPTATKAYDEMMNVFQKTLKKYVGDGGYNTSNYYQALKDFESNVTQNLPKGKEALLDEGGSARIQAAKDVRTVVRNMIGEKNPEFKGKMFDLASLYDARDNVITKAEKAGHYIQQFAKNHPIVSAVAGGLGATAGYQELKKVPVVGNVLP